MPKKHPTKWRSPTSIAVGVVCMVLAIGAAVPFLLPRTASQQQVGPLEHISTGLIGEYASLILIAENQGYFKKNGLEVTVQDYPSGPAALTDLLSGKLDTAMASDFAGVRNSFAGEDLKIIATMSKSEAFYLVGLKNHGISQITDLKGKRIGITRKTVGEFYLGQFLTFNKLNLSDVTIVNMPQTDLIDAATQGRVDAVVLFEPNAYNAAAALAANGTRWSLQSHQNLYSLLYSTGGFVRSRPETIKKYIRAIVQAEAFVKARDQQARDIVARRLRYDKTYIDYIWPQFSFAVSLDEELLINMDDEARWAIENNLTTARKIPNYLRMVYFEGLESIKPEAITIIR